MKDPIKPTAQEIDLLVHSAAQLLTLAGGPQRGLQLGQLSIIENGALGISEGRVIAVGDSRTIRSRFTGRQELDASGRVVLPGFVDPHTHLVWAGARAAEFELRLQGRSYMDILAAGGGILSTVRETRSSSEDALRRQAGARLDRMQAYGSTTVEAKTGYGLEQRTELRLLQTALDLDASHPVTVVPTFMPAHAVPPEFSGDVAGYVERIVAEMLPAAEQMWKSAAPGRPLPFVDVFCEPGAFDLGQTERILRTARDLGFRLKVHVDEFASLGGLPLAVELGATSVDHVVHTPLEQFACLGTSETVVVALPCTPFGLGERDYTPAQDVLKADGILALASDLNPGTAWCESMQFVIALACRAMRLTPAQAIAASTINAAAALGLAHETGSLEPGKWADLIVLDVDDYRHLGYRFGTNLVSDVVKAGRHCVLSAP